MSEEVYIWLNNLSLIRWCQWNWSNSTFWIHCRELHIFPSTHGRSATGSLWSCHLSKAARWTERGFPHQLYISVISRTMTQLLGSWIYFFTLLLYPALSWMWIRLKKSVFGRSLQGLQCVFNILCLHIHRDVMLTIRASCLGSFTISEAKLTLTVYIQYKQFMVNH